MQSTPREVRRTVLPQVHAGSGSGPGPTWGSTVRRTSLCVLCIFAHPPCPSFPSALYTLSFAKGGRAGKCGRLSWGNGRWFASASQGPIVGMTKRELRGERGTRNGAGMCITRIKCRRRGGHGEGESRVPVASRTRLIKGFGEGRRALAAEVWVKGVTGSHVNTATPALGLSA